MISKSFKTEPEQTSVTMRLFSRPSHYQITFLLVFLGLAWGITGGKGFRKKGSLNPTSNPNQIHKGFVQIRQTNTPNKNASRNTLSKEQRILFEGRVVGEISKNKASPLVSAPSFNGPSVPITPLSRVKLELVPLGKGEHTSQGILSFFSKTEGTFRFPQLIPGKYMLRLLPNDGRHLSRAIALDIPNIRSQGKTPKRSSPPKIEKEILLPLPRTMLGKLKAKESIKGLDQRSFWISVSENGLHRGTAKTDPSGAFQLDAVGTGPYNFTLRDQDGETLPVQQTAMSQDPQRHRVLVSLITP